MSVKAAGKQLSSGQYQVTDKHLVIESLPSGKFDLEIEVDVKPKENTSLEGLYNSSGTFCTQCEAEGFRGITYFYDRCAMQPPLLHLWPNWSLAAGYAALIFASVTNKPEPLSCVCVLRLLQLTMGCKLLVAVCCK